MNNSAIIVMDVCSSRLSKYYDAEIEVNDAFIKFLDIRLKELQNKNFKIIEINYYLIKNEHLTIKYDYSTTNVKQFKRYIKDNNIKNLIYTGFHYGRCTHIARDLSPIPLKKGKLNKLNFFVAPFLCRPLYTDYWDPVLEWLPEIPQVNL